MCDTIRHCLDQSHYVPRDDSDLLLRARQFISDAGCDEDDSDVNSERDKLLAEIDAALPPDAGWQPIATAPKDGTRILISNAERFPKNTYVARWLKEAWQIGPLGEWSAYPTHWTPLPSFYSHPAPPDAGDRG